MYIRYIRQGSNPAEIGEKRMGIPGQTGIVAFLTDATCGEACWEAREDICRCCCGGKNHGVLRTANGKRPERTAKIDGYRYILKAVGRELGKEARVINRAVGYKGVIKISDELTYHYFWEDNDKGAPARLKPATLEQATRWPELTAWRDNELSFYTCKPYLLWVRADLNVN